jgi:hypothetical protein
MPPHQGNIALLAHEVGHWLGLYHIFEDGCPTKERNNEGDLVRDTALGLETQYQDGKCSADVIPAKSLCTRPGAKQPESYPIENIMSNSPMNCRTSFTEGQFARMRDMYSWRIRKQGIDPNRIY